MSSQNSSSTPSSRGGSLTPQSDDTLFRLIQTYGTVESFGSFLQSFGISRPGSWSVAKERALDGLEASTLTEANLREYLSEAEEYGRQHVFLFRRLRSHPSAPSHADVRRWLESIGQQAVLQRPLIVDTPDQPLVAEVRRASGPGGDDLTIKIVETRVYTQLLSRTDMGNGRYIKEYQDELVRAANVVHLDRDGSLEFRIARHESSSGDYAKELSRVQAMVAEVLPPASYEQISLVKAKNRMYNERHNLLGLIRFSGTSMRHDDGINFTAAGKRQIGLFDRSGVDTGLAALAADGAYHDAINVWWLKQTNLPPSKDVHVLLAGSTNEIAFTQQCSRRDYEHILGQIRQFNR